MKQPWAWARITLCTKNHSDTAVNIISHNALQKLPATRLEMQKDGKLVRQKYQICKNRSYLGQYLLIVIKKQIHTTAWDHKPQFSKKGNINLMSLFANCAWK
jgi:hypothetical protein